MWACLRPRFVVKSQVNITNTLPLKLRSLSDDETKKLERKNLAVWSERIRDLARKREVLALISEYIQLQEQYVDSRLRNNEKLLEIAIDSGHSNSINLLWKFKKEHMK